MTDGAAPLIAKVRELGLMNHYALLGEGNMRRWDWEKMSGQLKGETLALWRFLLTGGKMPQADVESLLGKEALGFLKRHKLCKSENGELTLGGVCLLSYRDQLFFADMGTEMRTLFSDETRALISLLPKLQTGRCLCLYPTTGAEVMSLVAEPKVEVFFLDDDKDRSLLEANLEMGTKGKKPQFISRAQARRKSFDLILASPPSCVSVPGTPLPENVSGGPDGRKRIRECVEFAAKTLSPQGQMAMVFMFFSNTESPGMEKDIRAMLDPYGLSYHLLIPSKMLLEPGVPIFNQIVAISGHFSKNKSPEEVIAAVLTHLKDNNYGAVYLVKAILSKPAGDVRQHITNYSDDYYGMWTF
jgi:hypothetical protein